MFWQKLKVAILFGSLMSSPFYHTFAFSDDLLWEFCDHHLLQTFVNTPSSYYNHFESSKRAVPLFFLLRITLKSWQSFFILELCWLFFKLNFAVLCPFLWKKNAECNDQQHCASDKPASQENCEVVWRQTGWRWSPWSTCSLSTARTRHCFFILNP